MKSNYHKTKTNQLTIKQWLQRSYGELSPISSSAKLDLELILGHILSVNRTYLVAHDNDNLIPKQLVKANHMLKKRLKSIPIAHLLKQKEFYGRDFIVSNKVLIPKPESEEMINQLKSLDLISNPTIADVGTGSGCLGITAKLEIPKSNVTLLDISKPALRIARKNARLYNITVQILHSNLLQSYHSKTDVILANLPYIKNDQPVSIESEYEPKIALYADNQGLDKIFQLIDQSPRILTPNGYIIIEANPSQHNSIQKYAKRYNLDLHSQSNYVITLKYNQTK